MASSNDLKIIQQAKQEYAAAKKRKDFAGMRAAHLKADKARGFSTSTKVDTQGDYYQSVTSAKPPKSAPGPTTATRARTGALPTKKNTPDVGAIPSASFGDILPEYNISLPGIGRDVAKALPIVKKQEIAQGTQNFFEGAPSQAGFMQGFALNNPKITLEKKLGLKINTAKTESSLPYQIGQGAGIAAQFAIPYAGASKGIGTLTSKALPNLPKLGQKIAGSVATDLAVGLPLNANYALNKERLSGSEAAKSIVMNTGIDIATGGLIEGLPVALKAIKRAPDVPEQVIPQNINQPAAAESGITPFDEQEAINLSSHKGSVNGKDGDFKTFIQEAKGGKESKNFYFGKVSSDLADRINQATGLEVSGRNVIIRSDEIRHIFKNHGNALVENARGQIAVDDTLMEKLITVFDNPDEIVSLPTKDAGRRKAFELRKRINGYAIVVNGSSDGRNAIQIDSYRIINKKKPSIALDAQGPEQTSLTGYRPASSDSYISQSNHDVNVQGLTNPDQKFRDLGADTNKFNLGQKISKVRSNTIENSPLFEQAKANLDEDAYKYDVISEKQSMAEAKQRLEVDFDGEVNDLARKPDYTSADLDTAMGISEQYSKEAEATGDYSKLARWSKMIQEKATQGGQFIQSFAKYIRSPEGAIIKGQQEIGKAVRDIEKKNPNLFKKVDTETQEVMDAFKQAEQDTFEPIGDILKRFIDGKAKNLAEESDAAEMLARRVGNATAEAPTKEADAVRDMVNELFRVAKESPLPEKLPTNKRNPIEFLKSAIQNKAEYSDTWEQAKAILRDKYADDPETLAVLDNYFDKGIIPTYSQATLGKSINKTAEDLGIDFNDIIKQSKGDKKKALDDITNYLVQATGADEESAKQLALDVMNKYNEIIRTKTDSVLKRMFREVPRKGQKTAYQKVMELINMGAYDDDAIRDLIKAKNNIPVLDSDDVKNILENMKKADEFPEGDYMRKMYQARAEQIISNKVPKEFREKFRALQRLSMILNPKTLITRNPLGNTLLGAAENIKDIPADMIDKAVSLKTGERTTALAPIAKMRAQAQGFGQGVKEWAQDIKYGVDTSPSRGQFELPQGKTFSDKGIGRGLNFADQFLIRGLQIGDRPFYQAAYNGRLAELAKLGVTGQDAAEQARNFALDRVFQNDSELSKRAIQIRKTLGLPGDLLIPFTQTPANILDKLLDYSPAGLGKAVYQLGKTAGKGTFDQKKFVDTLGRTFTGGGIAMLAYAMFEKGILTGNLSENADVRQAEQLAGKQAYSIKIGDTYHSYDWAQPIAGIFAGVANAMQAGADKEDLTTALFDAGISSIDTVFEQSFLSGIMSAFSGYSPATGIGNALLGSTSQATPTFLANIAKTIDPTVRETYDPNVLKQQANKLVARIPLASETLPAKINVTGQEIQQSQGRGLAGRIFENFLAPQRVSQENSDPVNNELMRLQASVGDNAVLLNKAPKYFEKDGEKYTFDAADYGNYQKVMGQTAYQNIEKLIADPVYQSSDDKAKASMVKQILDEATTRARMDYFKNKGKSQLLAMDDSQREHFAEIKPAGVEEDQYIDTYYATRGVTGVKDDEGKTIRLSKSFLMKKAIDAANLDASPAQLRALYHSFDVSEKVW